MISGSKTQFAVALEQTASPEPEQNAESRIADIFADAGLDSVPPEVVYRLSALVEVLAYQRAGAALAFMLHLLPPTPPNLALRQAVLGSKAESITELARVAGCSRQNLSKHAKKMRAKLKTVAGVKPS